MVNIIPIYYTEPIIQSETLCCKCQNNKINPDYHVEILGSNFYLCRHCAKEELLSLANHLADFIS